MNLFIWLDLSLFILLFALFIYVFATVTITNLHKVYFMFHFFMMMWPLCQFATDIASDPLYQLIYVTLSFVAISLLGGGWLIFTIYMTGNADKLGKKRLLFIPAVISAIGVIFNPFQAFVRPLHGGYVQRTYGPWFWVMISIMILYFIVSFYYMRLALHSDKTLLTTKRQVKITLYGILVLLFFGLLDLVLNVVLKKWLPIIPGLSSTGIFLSDIFFVFAIIRYKAFDFVTIAHNDITNTIPYGILVLDDNETVIEVNAALQSYVPLQVGDHFDIGHFLDSVSTDGDKMTFLVNYSKGENTCIQLEIFMDIEATKHFILQVSPIFIQGHSTFGRTITFQDVTQLRYLVNEVNQQNETLQERNQSLISVRDELYQANQKLKEMAETDGLTQCYNRHYLTEQLKRDIMTNLRDPIPFSIILFDIDFFKAINDRFGHVVGDEVIYSTAQTVKKLLRRTDILARYGGEEFIIYLPHTDRQLAHDFAEQIRLAVAANKIRIGHDVSPISITISLGVLTIGPVDARPVLDLESTEKYLIQLFSSVDKELYRAKEKGRNRVSYAITN